MTLPKKHFSPRFASLAGEMNSKCLLLLFSCLSPVVLSWPTGAPSGACNTLIPNHGVSPQGSIEPYRIEAEQLRPGEFQVTITTVSGRSKPFKGFIIQVYVRKNRYWLNRYCCHSLHPLLFVCSFQAKDESGGIIGTFSLLQETRAKHLQCGANWQDSITHNSNSDKYDISVKWFAPQGYTDEVHFEGTVVEQKTRFWAGIKSEIFEVREPVGGEGGFGGASPGTPALVGLVALALGMALGMRKYQMLY